MSRKQVKIPKLECLRCGHGWYPRKPNVTVCPTCKSPYWNKPKDEKKPEPQEEQAQ